MKKITYSIFILYLLFLLPSCMLNLSVRVMKPAYVSVPQHIKSVAIINRALPPDEVRNVVEGIITGELPGQDKQGIEQALAGLTETLTQSARFEVKKTNEQLFGSGAGGTFPEPLSWDEVVRISTKYEVDAIITIETFDSDYIITNASKDVQKKNKEGVTVTEKEYHIEGVASVKLGFRIYDAKQKTIIDQYHYSHHKTWQAKGKTPTDAALHLLQRQVAINQVSYISGEMYAERIVPLYVTVHREYYKKSKHNTEFASGVRKATVNEWQGAIDTWLQVIKTADYKTKGRTAYNLAICYEVMGDLMEAKKWAQLSYTEYNNKNARSYVRILEGRIWEQEKLKEQMGE